MIEESVNDRPGVAFVTRTTHPGALALMQYEAEHPLPIAAEPEPEKAADPSPIRPRVKIAARWDKALLAWGLRQITQPHRISRWLAWWTKFPWRVASFTRVVTSRRISDEEYEARNDQCFGKYTENFAPCERLYFRIAGSGMMTAHCAGCGCPATMLSSLTSIADAGWLARILNRWIGGKNRKRRWYCPLYRHPGTYPLDKVRETLRRNGYDDMATLTGAAIDPLRPGARRSDFPPNRAPEKGCGG